jgi:hypothetical protein
MPLQIVGLEEVWRKFLSLPQYNYTAEEAKAYGLIDEIITKK